MRIRVDEAIEFYNKTHNGTLNQRELSTIVMPEIGGTAAQLYLIRLNKGKFGSKKSVNMEVIKRIMAYTGVSVEFLFDFENSYEKEIKEIESNFD